MNEEVSEHLTIGIGDKMTSKKYVQVIVCIGICIGCADSNSTQANGPEDGGFGSVTGTEPVIGNGGNNGGGNNASVGGVATSVSSGGTKTFGGTTSSISVGSGAGIYIPAGGALATGGSTGNCLSVTNFCSKNADCCNNYCLNGYCYDLPVSTGGKSSTGGMSSTGGSGTSGSSAGCANLGQSCSQFGTPCCASTSYAIVCSGVCQIALVAAGGSAQ